MFVHIANNFIYFIVQLISPFQKNGCIALNLAAQYGHAETVKTLIAAGLDIDMTVRN